MWLVSRLVSLYKQAMDATKELLIRLLMGILIFLGYVLLSLFIYAVIRRIMVPQKLHVLPVHLQYNSNCLGQVTPTQCSFPQVDFLLNNGEKLFRSGQYYRISLSVEAPENQLNIDAGVFMVNLTFYTTHQRFLATSARPMAVRYRSSLLRSLSTIVFAVPLLLGLWEQKQLLELVLFDGYYEPYGDGALSAKLFLENNRVHVYSTTLMVDANFSGFTYYLYQWPISMTIIVVISILITLCTCTVLIWVRDVINDFEERRAMHLQQRRGRGMPQRVGGARTGEHRATEQRRAQQRAVGSDGDVSETPTAETLTSGEEGSGQRAEVPSSSGTMTPTDTRESSELRETESEMSGGLQDMISNLRSLQREVDADDEDTASTASMDTPTSGPAAAAAGDGGGGAATPTRQPSAAAMGSRREGRNMETGELRRRAGN